MSLLEELYQDTILDHYQEPSNKGILDNPDLCNHGANPLCGDEIDIYVSLTGDRIKEIRFFGQGCAISQASASMMTEALVGKTLTEVRSAIQVFKKMMLDNGEAIGRLGEEFEDLDSLEGVKKYPVRIKCAILSWNTLLEGLEQGKMSS